MITSKICFKKFGNPRLLSTEQKWMTLWIVPSDIREAFSHVYFADLGTIGFPKKIYGNKLFIPLLEKALRNVMDRKLTKELKSWDGVFVIRKKVSNDSMSLHSWGIAVDVNRHDNEYGQKPTLSHEFVKCFTDEGLEWGGYWKTPDGMHFQLAKIPDDVV